MTPMTVASTFDARLAARHAEVIGDEVKRKGNDVTLVTYSKMLQTSMRAVKQLEGEGIRDGRLLSIPGRPPDLIAMVPERYARPGLLVNLTGALELAGAAGLLGYVLDIYRDHAARNHANAGGGRQRQVDHPSRRAYHHMHPAPQRGQQLPDDDAALLYAATRLPWEIWWKGQDNNWYQAAGATASTSALPATGAPWPPGCARPPPRSSPRPPGS